MVDRTQLHARVKQAESRGNAAAVSPAGAVGAMQTLPSTLVDPGFGVTPASDPKSAAERERVGHDYLDAMLDRYDGNERLALIAYNWGPARADEIAAGKRKADDLPDETTNYIAKILGANAPAAKGAAPTAVREEGPDMSHEYNTKLPPAQRAAYNAWLGTLNGPKQRSLYDYDLQGAFLAGAKPDPIEGHLPDTWKKPNHPTFSDQSQYAGVPGARPGHWEGKTFVPPEPETPPNASQEAVGGQTYTHQLKVDGVTFTVQSDSTDKATAAQQLVDALHANPAALASAASSQGMHYDFNTGRAREYTGLEKFWIGAGEVTQRTIDGSKELYNKARGNAEAVANLENKTDEERALFAAMDDKSIGAEDVGQLFAYAPTLFGPGGILRSAVMFGAIAGEQATGTEDTHLGNAALGALAGAGGEVGGRVLATAGRAALNTARGSISAIGAGGMARTAVATALDVMMTGGGANAANAAVSGFLKVKNILKKLPGPGKGVAEWDRSGGVENQLPKSQAEKYMSFIYNELKGDSAKALLRLAAGFKNDSPEVIAARQAHADVAAAAPEPIPVPVLKPQGELPTPKNVGEIKAQKELKAQRAAAQAAVRTQTDAANVAAQYAHRQAVQEAKDAMDAAVEKQTTERATTNARAGKTGAVLAAQKEDTQRAAFNALVNKLTIGILKADYVRK